jgi:Tol biopolymer transport system component
MEVMILRKIVILVILLVSIWGFANTGNAEAETPLKAAFVRDGDLWVIIGDQEKRVTEGKRTSNPVWSNDGEWLAYLEEEEGGDESNVWIFDLKSDRKHLVFQADASNLQWAPDKNVLAFTSRGVLNVSDTQKWDDGKFENITVGVGNYSWLPNGKAFLVSTKSNPAPSGWTDIEFHEIYLTENEPSVEHFYSLPALPNDNDFGVGTSIFKWSQDHKWIAFIKYPTASMSADSNSLYVLSSDGKQLMKTDEMLNEPNWFKWAPTRNSLAFIGGHDRIAIHNKFLKVKEFPASTFHEFTPKGYVDRDFTWHNDYVITVARSEESEWSNDPDKRPLPSLYQVNIKSNKQKRVTHPPKYTGDFNPQYLKQTEQLAWVRTNRKSADVWLADSDGRNAKIWITKIDQGTNYYEKWDWSSVLSIYNNLD